MKINKVKEIKKKIIKTELGMKILNINLQKNKKDADKKEVIKILFIKFSDINLIMVL